MNGIDNILAALTAAAILLIVPAKIYSSAMDYEEKQKVIRLAERPEEDLSTAQLRGELMGLSVRVISISLEGEKGKELQEIFYEDYADNEEPAGSERRVKVIEVK